MKPIHGMPKGAFYMIIRVADVLLESCVELKRIYTTLTPLPREWDGPSSGSRQAKKYPQVGESVT